MSDRELQDTLESRLLLLGADWLTAFLLSVGTVFPYLEAYFSERIAFDFSAMMAVCVFGSLAAALLFTWRHGTWAGLGVGAVGGMVLWRLWEHMTEDWLLGRPPWLGDLTGRWPWALYLLAALAVLVLGWTAVRARAWWLAAAIAVLPTLPAIQEGQLPAWWAMLAGFAGWGAMLFTDLFDRQAKGNLGRAKLLSLGGTGALVLVLVLCLPMKGYARPQWATDARRELILGTKRQLSRFFDQEALDNNILTQLGLDLTVEESASGYYGWGGSVFTEESGTGMGPRENLANVGPRRYAGRALMEVGTDQPDAAGRMYLKGASFGRYTGTSWESGSGPEDFYPERFPLWTAPDAPVYTMRIRDARFRNTWYYPYRYSGADQLDDDGRLTIEGEQALDPGFTFPEAPVRGNVPVKEYYITYSPGGPEDGFVPLREPYTLAKEINYRLGIRSFETYQYLPGTLRDNLSPLVDEIEQIPVTMDERLPGEYLEPVAAAARTAAWLASMAEYDPDTPAMGDEAEDFVLHFLEEKRGFCVHFATAGAMLLRAQGIPTRYINGFVAELNGQGQGTVLDSDAHAWVEIYLDGYGWYPVEMTPGYAGGVSGAGLAGAVGESEDAAPDDEEVPEESLPDEEENPEEDVPEETGDPADSADPAEEAAAPEEDVPEERGIALPWKVLFGFAVFWAVLCAAYLLALLVRTRARQDGNTNRSVLNAYGRYKRLRRWGCGEDDELDRLAKKAKFSQHTLTETERESAWKCLSEDVKQSRIGQPIRRRWLLALLEPVF